MESVRTAELPPDLRRPLQTRRRVALASEILAVYCRVRLRLLRDRFPIALAAMRDAGSRRRLACDAGQPSDSAINYLRAARVARAVQRTLRLVPADSRCLMQSLVLTSLLARRGIETKLVIAVKPDGEFEAHAWVEHGGRPLLPDSQDVYQVLAKL
jgi:transglutaminase superfamily protein